MDEQQYLDAYEHKLQDSLVSLCSAYEMMGGELLESDDLESKFTETLARPYLADAVKEYRAFPEAALAWAGYAGMAMAKLWDADWQAYQAATYADLLGPRGFDDMDERITTEILGYALDSEAARRIAGILSNCAVEALTMIRHENIEPQSPRAYYVFARTVQILYRTGASIELFLLGYKRERIG